MTNDTLNIVDCRNLFKKYGKNITIVNPSNIYGCEIGDSVFIGPFCEIQRGVVIGNNTRIQSHSFICEGVYIGNDVFIAHGVITTNDDFPIVNNKDWKPKMTIIKDGVSIGSNVTLLSGITLYEGCLIGAGSVVTKSVPKNEIWVGNPAKFLRMRE